MDSLSPVSSGMDYLSGNGSSGIDSFSEKIDKETASAVVRANVR